MASECIISKFNGSMSDDALLKVGEFIWEFPAISNPTGANRTISLVPSTGVTVPIRIIGDGHFTDSTLTDDLGKTDTLTSSHTQVYLSNDNVKVAIKAKYNGIWDMRNLSQNANGDHHSIVNIEDLKYCTYIGYLFLMFSKSFGDISCFKDKPSLRELALAYTGAITGDISVFSTTTKLTKCDLTDNNGIYGDVSVFAQYPNMTIIGLSGTSVTGDVTSIVANCNSLTVLSIPSTVTITDEQIGTLKGRGCSVLIDGNPQ